jgi:hypothetical protein
LILNFRKWHFLPAVATKPIHLIVADMPQELVGAAGTVCHSRLKNCINERVDLS